MVNCTCRFGTVSIFAVGVAAFGGCAPDDSLARRDVLDTAAVSLGANSVTTSGNAMALAQAMLASTSAITVKSASYDGAPAAGGVYSDGPMGLARGAILTTGTALNALPPNDRTNTSKNNGRAGSALCSSLAGGATTYDAAKLTIHFDLADHFDGISFLSVFGSEEYKEYVGSQFNDVYGVYLNGVQVAFDKFGEPITINGPFFASSEVVTGAATETEYDGSTEVLQTRAPLAGGSKDNVLELVICDTGDRVFDSGVFIANLNGCVGHDCSGTVPCSVVDADHDGATACDDCDDSNPSLHSGTPGNCDLIGNPCNGANTCMGCGSDSGLQENAPWPMARRCPSRSAQGGATLGALPTRRWGQVQPHRQGQASAIAADGTIYSAGQDLVALRPDGTQKWVFAVGVQMTAPAIGADGTIYCAADKTAFALNPDGAMKWTMTSATASFRDSPTLSSDGTIYFPTRTKLIAVNPNGSQKWAVDPGGENLRGPSLRDGVIYLSTDEELVALNTSGGIAWKYYLHRPISPMIGLDGTIYVATSNWSLLTPATIWALNANGTLKWKKELSLGTDQGAAALVQAADGTIYAPVTDGALFALSAQGTVKWSFPSLSVDGQNARWGTPIVAANGTLYVGWGTSWQGGLAALNPDGTLQWNMPSDASLLGDAAMGADGTLYLGYLGLWAVGH